MFTLIITALILIVIALVLFVLIKNDTSDIPKAIKYAALNNDNKINPLGITIEGILYPKVIKYISANAENPDVYLVEKSNDYVVFFVTIDNTNYHVYSYKFIHNTAGFLVNIIDSSFLKKQKEADERAFRKMADWAALANSSAHDYRETMSKSLVVQAGLILEEMQVMKLEELRNLINRPKLCKSNFVYLILSLAPNFVANKDILKDVFDKSQARAYLAHCIRLIIVYGLYDDDLKLPALEAISIQACSEPMTWE